MSEFNHHQLLHYAELERQILLLIADDDEEYDVVVSQKNGSVFGGKTLILPLNSTATKHASSADVVAVGTDYRMSENNGTAVTWQKSNGTGVFIPQTIKSQTNSSDSDYRSTGRMNYGRRMKRQMEYKNHILNTKHVWPK